VEASIAEIKGMLTDLIQKSTAGNSLYGQVEETYPSAYAKISKESKRKHVVDSDSEEEFNRRKVIKPEVDSASLAQRGRPKNSATTEVEVAKEKKRKRELDSDSSYDTSPRRKKFSKVEYYIYLSSANYVPLITVTHHIQ